MDLISVIIASLFIALFAAPANVGGFIKCGIVLNLCLSGKRLAERAPPDIHARPDNHSSAPLTNAGGTKRTSPSVPDTSSKSINSIILTAHIRAFLGPYPFNSNQDINPLRVMRLKPCRPFSCRYSLTNVAGSLTIVSHPDK